ncbi:fumarylacetoacetate hydrolase family protein [Streptomyces violaceoruber]
MAPHSTPLSRRGPAARPTTGAASPWATTSCASHSPDHTPLEPHHAFRRIRTPTPPPGGRRGRGRHPLPPAGRHLAHRTDPADRRAPRVARRRRRGPGRPPGPACLPGPVAASAAARVRTGLRDLRGARGRGAPVRGGHRRRPRAVVRGPDLLLHQSARDLRPRGRHPRTPGSAVLDFELEVGAVVGREGRDLTAEQARDHIVGYTVFNDWSARDLQGAEMRVGLGPCKGKDTATTLGPYLVTADELEPYRDREGFLRLALTAEVNGEKLGEDLLSNMSWTFEEMTAYASRGTRVVPGDVLGSGTCGNGGCLAELWGLRGEQTPPPLKPGDTVTLTVEGIGTLTNTVVPGVEPVPLPVGRRRSRERP